MKKNLLAALLALSLSGVMAQEQRVVSQFFMNPYVYNPAYAGVEGHTAVYVMYRSQWVGLEGAPTFSHVNMHTPLKKGIALGFLGYNDQESILTTSGLKGTVSYLAAFDKKHYVRFGMSIGLGTTSLDVDQIDNPFDPAFANLIESSTFAIADFGISYHSGHFNFGFSMPNLVSREVLSEDGFSKVRLSPTENVLFKVNYRGHITDDFAVEPHVIYRFSTVNASQFEVATIVHIKHLIWVGGSFREDAGMSALIGFKIKEKIGIGYAYELGNSDISSLTGATHELHIGYHLGSKKEHAEHVSSFIKSHRKSAEERAIEAESNRQERLLALQKASEIQADARERETRREQKEEVEPIEQEVKEEPQPWNEPDISDQSLIRQAGTVTERGVVFERENESGETERAISWIPDEGAADETWKIAEPDSEPTERANPDGSKEIGVKWLVTNDNGTKNIVIKWSPLQSDSDSEPEDRVVTERNDVDTNIVDVDPIVSDPVDSYQEEGDSDVVVVEETPEQPMTNEDLERTNSSIRVKRGTHVLELPHGNHVVVGAFSVFDHAEDFSDDLFDDGFHDVIVGYVTARGYYYTVVYRSNSLNEAEAEKNRLKKKAGFEKVWVLTVE